MASLKLIQISERTTHKAAAPGDINVWDTTLYNRTVIEYRPLKRFERITEYVTELQDKYIRADMHYKNIRNAIVDNKKFEWTRGETLTSDGYLERESIIIRRIDNN